VKPARVLRVAAIATSIGGFLGGGGRLGLLGVGVGGGKFGFLCGGLGGGITGGLLGGSPVEGGPREIGGAGTTAAREGFEGRVGAGGGAARVGVFFEERRGREAARGGERAGTGGGAVVSAAAASGHICVE